MHMVRKHRSKTGGKVVALMYLYREVDDEETKQELEVQGYFTPEQQATEIDPPVSMDMEFESATVIATGQPIVLTQDEVEQAINALWLEITENEDA